MREITDMVQQGHTSQTPIDSHMVKAYAVKSHAVLDTIEWLSGNECHELDDAGLIAALGQRLRLIGLPIDRLTLHLRTLHPEILGRTLAWAPNEPVEIHDRTHGIFSVPAFANSPLRQAMETGEALLVRLDGAVKPSWADIDVFQGRNLIEQYIVPLCNADGPVSAACFCTAFPRGFTVSEMAALERIVPALRNVCELRALRRTELTLLDTYIGATTAQRILAGHIRRGSVETLEAALLLCDLRGFTDLSNRLPGTRVLKLLDIYFDRVSPAITGSGGEILKFMGDAVLAFFSKDDAAAACEAALASAMMALGRLGEVSLPDARLQAGMALHYGEVSYGNIGSGQRLDFTVIGPDVNLLSRIQTACAPTNQPLLMSSRMAKLLTSKQTVSIGRHALRGFSEPIELHGLVPSDSKE
jgi:adenylate cyclase